MNSIQQYLAKRDRLVSDYRGGNTEFRLAKSGMTNLFRYGGNARRETAGLKVDDFNLVLGVNPEQASVDVEGMATIEAVLTATLKHGLLPKVSPELKHITVGGAIVGIGIESSCFLHGFFHEGVAQAEVLLPNGDIVVCTADNEYADLFHALPNSFGTLGYVLRATLKLMPAKAYTLLTNSIYSDVDHYLAAFDEYIDNPEGVFLEGMFFSRDELYLIHGEFRDSATSPISIYRGAPFYKKIRKAGQFEMRTDDYIFRFDPDWFWNVPDRGIIELFRQWGPKSLRNSKFYTRYTRVKRALLKLAGISNANQEELIQDWVVPWNRAAEFIEFIFDNIDIQGQPWVALPIVPKIAATLYPLKTGQRYMNIGCYCFVDKPSLEQDYYYTRVLDQLCFDMGGIKMLYSSTFLTQQAFGEVYNGVRYQEIKQKYDPQARALTLYQKAAAKA